MEELTSERRRRWIPAISRENLTDCILESDRVCSKDFVLGEPAKDWVRFNVDWFPTLCLGHSRQKLKTPRQLKFGLEELSKDGNVDLSCLKKR